MGKLVRMITDDGAVMAIAIDSTDIVARAEQLHNTSAVVTAALGRLLTATSMMGNMLKGADNTITLKIAGNGKIGSMIAVSDSKGDVRGYAVNTVVELPLKENGKLDVGTAVGNDGMVTVIKDLGMKEPYVGQIPIVSGEIAEDITSYYAISEQIPTACALGVLVNPDLTVKAAGGYIIQLLPGADDKTIELIEKAISKAESVTTMMTKGMGPEEILKSILSDFETEKLYEQEVEYRCNCSRQRTEKVLLAIGPDDLNEIASDEKVQEVKCSFCDKSYEFTPSELRKLASVATKKN